MPTIRWRPMSGNSDDGSTGTVWAQRTSTRSTLTRRPRRRSTPRSCSRPLLEPESSGLLRWRRQAVQAPILRLDNYYVKGRLNLRAADLDVLFRFENCRFEYPPDVREAKLLGLSFRRCWLPGLKARNFRSRNDVRLIPLQGGGGRRQARGGHRRPHGQDGPRDAQRGREPHRRRGQGVGDPRPEPRSNTPRARRSRGTGWRSRGRCWPTG